jgi:glycolate oxidase iron-sulfur subunit
MQTNLHPDILATDKGQRADAILRTCVHCGFCNATCPTYELLGDELDGPRGRIYLIKDLLESNSVNQRAQTHLDRCLTCLSCETTCPSGVAYGELLEIGREHLAGGNPAGANVKRGWFDRLQRSGLVWLVPNATRFRRWASLGNWFRWLLPPVLRRQLPKLEASADNQQHLELNPTTENEVGSVLLMDGCVQKAATPSTNTHLQKLLQNHNVRVERIAEDGCCGGATLHLGSGEDALVHMRELLDQVAPWLDKVDAILSSASGCGVTLKDYPRLLAGDADYLPMAQQFADKLVDASEYLRRLPVTATSQLPKGVGRASVAAGDGEPQLKVAWHSPCTLQHGQKLTGHVEKLLGAAGYMLVPVADAHICCGSAGTYAITQPKLSEQLQLQKVAALQAAEPDIIATANVGCQLHIGSAAQVPVVHWITLLE